MSNELDAKIVEFLKEVEVELTEDFKRYLSGKNSDKILFKLLQKVYIN